MSMRPMMAFLVGIFLMFIGFSLKDLGIKEKQAVQIKAGAAETNRSQTGAVIGIGMMVIGTVLVFGSLVYTIRAAKNNQQDQ